MGTLAELSATVESLLKSQADLQDLYCPTDGKEDACLLDPPKTVDISTIGGIVFVVCVGLCVGTDVTLGSFRNVLLHSKRGFFCGVVSQFLCMPLLAYVMTHIFKEDLTKSALYSYEAVVLGITVVGSLPGGNTSNLFAWFCGGNVALSILMSLFSNIAALGMMPLILYLMYEQRFDDTNAPEVPYTDIFIPLVVTVVAVGIGMLVKAKCTPDTIWYTAKISSVAALLFLVLAVIIGIRKYPKVLMETSYSSWLVGLLFQPLGYACGWGLATLTKCSLREKLTIAFETGVQSFTLGLVIAQLGFNQEKEVCQFHPSCMELLGAGGAEGLSKYEAAVLGDSDARFPVGTGLGEISVRGFMPGGAGDALTGGCCRFNELVYQDVFRTSALCSLLYALHAWWLITLLRKWYPRGFRRDDHSVYVPETVGWGTYTRERSCTADRPVSVAAPSAGVGSYESIPAATMAHLFYKARDRCGNELALAQEWPVPPCPKEHKLSGTVSRPIDTWKRWTWREYCADAETVARAFIALGMENFGAVAIFGFNAPQWHIAAMGAILAGGKAAGIYPTDTVEQVAYKTKHSGAVVVVVEDNSKLARYKKCIEQLPEVKAIVVFATEPDSKTCGGCPVYAWDALMDIGHKAPAAQLEDRVKQMQPGQAAALVYTSGTTGMPKAVILSHDNLLFSTATMRHLLKNSMGVEYESERILSYLPLSHIAGFFADVVMPLSLTACSKSYASVYFARPYDLKEGTLKNRLTFVQPTLFLGVPRVWEKFAEGLQAAAKKLRELTGIWAQMPILCCFSKVWCSTWAKSEGLKTAEMQQYGHARFGHTSRFYGLAEGLILSTVQAALGLDLSKFNLTGAAPIQHETLQYFGSLGMSINEVYGMSESCGVGSISTSERHIWGSCGFAAPGTQVKIFKVGANGAKTECPAAKDIMAPSDAEQGEICFRGRHVMTGYLANPKLGPEHVAQIEQATRDAIDDEGWLHSGDMGCLGENGMVRITGRYKELIITAGGENVAPVPLEDSVKALCPAVSNAMMVGDKKKFNTMLVSLKTVGATGELPGSYLLAGDAASLVPGITTVQAAIDSTEYRKKIQEAIEKTNANSKICPSNASKIQKFEILPYDLSSDGEELTPTLKLKRKVVEAKYKDLIDFMYGARPDRGPPPPGGPSEAPVQQPPIGGRE